VTYADVLQFIESTEKFGMKPGLDAIQRLLSKLNNPQDQLKVIHIAGTNGKGSTASFIKSMLKHGGYRVGFYTSPSLYALEERIQINDVYIDQEAFVHVAGRVKAAVGQLVEEGYDPNTEFEIFTAMALLYFEMQQVDFVILEVGLGGRLDATNVVDKPLISIITPIALDHVSILGDTLEKVAYEKGGIIKNGVPVVIHPQEIEAYKVLEAIADEHDANLIGAPVDLAEVKSISLEGTFFELGARHFKLSMIGAHQVRNAVVAMTAVETLRREYGVSITEEAIETGLEKAHWPCRLEVIPSSPKIILDGAHNPHGAEALRRALSEIVEPNQTIRVLVGMLADKDVDEVLDIMAPYMKDVTVTEPDNARKMEAETLAEKLRSNAQSLSIVKDIKKAYRSIIERSNSGDLILMFGSFYLVGLLRQEALHDYNC
jgi:dihydrofolate synthase/folylpolyglutamate synthase